MSYVKKLLENSDFSHLEYELQAAVDMIIECYKNGGKVLICGNGGSAADSEHIAGELLKGFYKKRPLDNELKDKIGSEIAERLQYGLPAISLVSHSSLISAVMNDIGADLVYAQQVLAFGKSGDVLIGISTSGNAVNISGAIDIAKAIGVKVISFTGQNDSVISAKSDITLKAPATCTPNIQEIHIKLYHALCGDVEAYFFNN